MPACSNRVWNLVSLKHTSKEEKIGGIQKKVRASCKGVNRKGKVKTQQLSIWRVWCSKRANIVELMTSSSSALLQALAASALWFTFNDAVPAAIVIHQSLRHHRFAYIDDLIWMEWSNFYRPFSEYLLHIGNGLPDCDDLAIYCWPSLIYCNQIWLCSMYIFTLITINALQCCKWKLQLVGFLLQK